MHGKHEYARQIRMLFVLVLCGLLAPSVRAGTVAEDDNLGMAVERWLQRSDAVDAHLIEVHSRDGVVTLTGSVIDLLSRQRAESIASSLKGVRSVINRIRVEPPDIEDLRLIAWIRQAIEDDPATSGKDIEAGADDGIVLLTGTVDSFQERKIAGLVASGVAGVRQVRNRIAVRPPKARPDGEIAAEVGERLAWDTLVDASTIEIEVEDAIVHLSGVTGSLEEKSRAYADAWVVGVRDVKAEDLEVNWVLRGQRRKPGSSLECSDHGIAKAIREAFCYDPRIVGQAPRVRAEAGQVTLSGAVSSLKSKRAAEQIARDTIGVLDVQNRIRVLRNASRTWKDVRRAVQAAIERTASLQQHELVVHIQDDGTALLHGKVDSRHELCRALEAAASVPGVVRVQDRIEIRSESQLSRPERDDWAMEHDVERALDWSPRVHGDNIEVEVTDGVVTLTGNVDSHLEMRSAVQRARLVGARKVVNRLAINQPRPAASRIP